MDGIDCILRRPLRFPDYTFAGSLAWRLALAYTGDQSGQRWQTGKLLHAILHQLDYVVVVLALLLAAFVLRRCR